ncbi:MAG TPA: hypothetical protein VFO07_16340, partial [Roseiflexaceae bacterium]|nr:hypothetical protein [Roseiflexaceae bacterium]
VLLVKPFYAILFLAFALLQIAGHPATISTTLKTLAVALATSEVLAGILWLLLLGITIWIVRRRRLSFSLTWALAFMLLYWGRPVGWGLIYLELVLLSSTWPSLPRWGRLLLLAVVAALMVSHWWALVLTARGEGMPLLTLQRADLPWETWLVLPLSWLLVLRAAVWTSTRPPASPLLARTPA